MRARVWPIMPILSSLACDTHERSASSAASIIGGTIDEAPAHWPGVVEIEASGQICSGTLIAATPTVGWVLTAAHCLMVEATALPRARALTFDVHVGSPSASGVALRPSRVALHPLFGSDALRYAPAGEAIKGTLIHDFAVVEVTGVTGAAAASVISAMQPVEDVLYDGAVGELVGYGVTAANGSPDGRRRRAMAALDGIATSSSGVSLLMIDARGTAPAACHGDSGGAFIVTTTSGPRLAGVISGGANACDEFGVNGRVSGAYEQLIRPALAGRIPTPESCLSCVYVASPPGGACHDVFVSNRSAKLEFASCLDMGNGPAACRARFPAGAAAYDLYWDCLATECSACSVGDRAMHECYSTFDFGGACDDCVVTSCCDELAACALDPACAACQDRIDVDPASCGRSSRWVAARGCLEAACDATCAPILASLPALPTPDAGAPLDAVGSADASALDAQATLEAGSADAAAAARVDAGSADASGDEAPVDAGCGCTLAEGPTEASQPAMALLLVVWIARRRRR